MGLVPRTSWLALIESNPYSIPLVSCIELLAYIVYYA